MAAVSPTGRAGDLYERYADQILGYCLHKLGSREEAEDAVQTTFLNALRGLERGVVPRSESAWLFKIAENVCLSRHRSSFRRGRVEAPSDLQALQDVVPAPAAPGDELIPLGQALARMPESQRRAILLREWRGLSYREIGAELGLSQAAVETLIFRARRSLAQGLARARGALDVGALLGALKAALTSGAVVKVAAVAAVAATGATAVAVADRPQPRRHAPPPVRHRLSRPLVAPAPERTDAPRKRVQAPPSPVLRQAPARRRPVEATKPAVPVPAPTPARARPVVHATSPVEPPTTVEQPEVAPSKPKPPHPTKAPKLERHGPPSSHPAPPAAAPEGHGKPDVPPGKAKHE